MKKIIIAYPSGFCAGVERAINMVNDVIKLYPNKQIYINHEIVHNRLVIEGFKGQGIIFSGDISQMNKGDVMIISAHGTGIDFEKQANEKGLIVIDATCPLVKKVHNFGEKMQMENHHIIIIGHKNHPEIIGTNNRLKNTRIISDIDEIDMIEYSENMSYITQTTFSKYDAHEIISALKNRFPHIKGQEKGDICYATSNRQDAVKSLAQITDYIIVVGSKNSSNSNRLCDIARQYVNADLIDDVSDINMDKVENAKNIGITAGASTPKEMINNIVNYIKKDKAIEEKIFKEERVVFPYKIS